MGVSNITSHQHHADDVLIIYKDSCGELRFQMVIHASRTLAGLRVQDRGESTSYFSPVFDKMGYDFTTVYRTTGICPKHRCVMYHDLLFLRVTNLPRDPVTSLHPTYTNSVAVEDVDGQGSRSTYDSNKGGSRCIC